VATAGGDATGMLVIEVPSTETVTGRLETGTERESSEEPRAKSQGERSPKTYSGWTRASWRDWAKNLK